MHHFFITVIANEVRKRNLCIELLNTDIMRAMQTTTRQKTTNIYFLASFTHPKWNAIMIRVRLIRRPRMMRMTERDHRQPTVTTGYQRNTCVLPKKGSAARK